MKTPNFNQGENQYSESVEQQVHEFQEYLDAMTGVYQKATIMMAADCIKRELQEIDKPEPPILLNPRRVFDLFFLIARRVVRGLSPRVEDKSQGYPVVIDILPQDLIEID